MKKNIYTNLVSSLITNFFKAPTWFRFFFHTDKIVQNKLKYCKNIVINSIKSLMKEFYGQSETSKKNSTYI